ncbi:MAG: tetratricopeptide repeat protein [Candidatus Latescibacteria bacterium]|nr:tetratricopeptide repeat protein [Candidatus Latescibacterota bacterium]
MLIVVSIVVMGAVPGSVGERVDDLYRQGNAFYEQGEYAKASAAYERIIQQGFHNGYVYYNLGNAYFKQQQLGKAILSYERARRLMPRDPDVWANLEIANLMTIDKLQPPSPWIGFVLVLRVYQWLNVNEAISTASTLYLLLGVIVSLAILTERPGLRRVLRMMGMIVVAGLLVFGTIAGAKVYEQASVSRAIVLATQADARSGPGPSYDLLFSLHEGANVTVLEQRGAWVRIALPDGKGGWMEQIAVGVI